MAISEPRASNHPETPPPSRRRPSVDLKTVLALAAAVGSCVAAYRSFADTGTVRAAARQSAGVSLRDRLAAVSLLASSDASDADVAVPALARACQDADPQVRRLATYGLGRVLDFESRAVKPGAPRPARLKAHARAVFAAYTRALRDPDPEVRLKALSGLHAVLYLGEVDTQVRAAGPGSGDGLDIRACLEGVLGALQSPDPRARLNAVGVTQALGTLLDFDPAEHLLPMLHDADGDVALYAFQTLCSSQDGINVHLKILFDRAASAVAADPNDRPFYETLRNAQTSGAMIPDLIDRLSDPTWQARAAAAAMLGRLGPESKSAVPSLLKALERGVDDPKDPADLAESDQDELQLVGDFDPIVGPAKALADIEVPESVHRGAIVPLLRRALKSPRYDRRMAAAEALERSGRFADSATDDLAAVILGEPRMPLRLAAAGALRNVSYANPRVRPVLESLTATLKARRDAELGPLIEVIEGGLRLTLFKAPEPSEPTDVPPSPR